MKRVVAIGDLHAGHCLGLTPKAWQFHPTYKDLQRKLWSFYADTLDALGPIDVLIVNGDAIDGKGDRSGGTEIIVPDLKDQVSMAVECIARAKAKHVVMTYGTPYHVAGGDGTDYEAMIAEAVGAKIGGHEWVDVNGVVFDVKHKIGGSSVPHGRHTAVARERVWNLFWSEHGESPKADILLRSHVHYHTYQGDPDWLGMTLPALQGPGSKYGVRQCSGIVHFGLVHFDIHHKGEMTWKAHTLKFKGLVKPHTF